MKEALAQLLQEKKFLYNVSLDCGDAAVGKTMKHVVHSVRYVGLSLMALFGIALGGGAGAVIGAALAYLVIVPIVVITAALLSSPSFDPMGIGFPVMENCAIMGFAAGGVVATFLISCRYRAIPERLR